MWFWCSYKFKCDVLKWIFESMNTHTLLPPTPSPPSSSQSDPSGCDLEMPATRMWRWQLHSGAQIQEWNCHFCPLFPMETMPSTAPSTCCPHSSVRRDQDHLSLTRGALVGFAHVVAAVNVTFPLPVTLISPWLQSTNLLMTFFLMSYNKVTITTGLPWKRCHFYCQSFWTKMFL